jgi:hypothetical protein
VYALKNDLEEIIKIKGLTKEGLSNNNIDFDSLQTLLNKDYSLILNQRKWFRSLSEANINIMIFFINIIIILQIIKIFIITN